MTSLKTIEQGLEELIVIGKVIIICLGIIIGMIIWM